MTLANCDPEGMSSVPEGLCMLPMFANVAPPVALIRGTLLMPRGLFSRFVLAGVRLLIALLNCVNCAFWNGLTGACVTPAGNTKFWFPAACCAAFSTLTIWSGSNVRPVACCNGTPALKVGFDTPGLVGAAVPVVVVTGAGFAPAISGLTPAGYMFEVVVLTPPVLSGNSNGDAPGGALWGLKPLAAVSGV